MILTIDYHLKPLLKSKLIRTFVKILITLSYEKSNFRTFVGYAYTNVVWH